MITDKSSLVLSAAREGILWFANILLPTVLLPQNVHNSKNKDDFIGTMFPDNFLCAAHLCNESSHVNAVARLDSTEVTHSIRAYLFPLLARDNLESQHHVSN